MDIEIKIRPEWNIIKSIRQTISECNEITSEGGDFTDAALLTAIELTENALKYTDHDPSNKEPIVFKMDADSDQVEITLKNYCTNDKSKQIVRDIIDELAKGDPFELYVQRLQMIRDNPDGHSRLGLYRIAYEGEFKLRCEINEETVVVTAVRKIA